MELKEAIKELYLKRPIEVSPYQGAIDMAMEALDKQIPIRPIMKSWCPAYCPLCHAELSESKGDGYYKHYTNLKICDCGQKLKWN